MVSQLAWLNYDDAQMRQALPAIDLFKEEAPRSCTRGRDTSSSCHGSSTGPPNWTCSPTIRRRAAVA
jgi:hypothetical protein